MKKLCVTFCAIMICTTTFSQVFTNKVVGKKKSDQIDSLKSSEYPYTLPILGAKATKAGYNLPYSAGLSVQYLWQKQDLIIENLFVGFNNGELHDLDEIVRFDNAVSEASGINIRPDIWLLPFLNVYGICAVSKPTTTVGFGIWVPDSSNVWNEVYSTTSKAEFNAVSLGFGMTPTIGVGGGFLALDMNFTWTDVDALDKPAFSFIFDPRFGKSIAFKNPERTLAVWVGGFRWSISSDTKGSINLADVISTDNLGGKIDEGYAKVSEAQVQVETWWSNLSNIEQNNPINSAKYNAANQAIETAGIFLNAADAAADNASNSTVQYSLEKRPAMKWNFLVGGQFQYNKHWMVRAEFGFLGSRQHFFTGLQYRFGL